jgi:hypothetical protein
VQSFLDQGSLKSLSTAEFFDEMLELRLDSLQLSVDLIREMEGNKELKKQFAGLAKEWEHSLVNLIKGMRDRGEIRDDADSQSLSRGILALRDGLYGQLSIGANMNEVRNTWVYVMGLIMRYVEA